MSAPPLRLLLVEDDPLDRDIVQRLLERAGVAFELDHAGDVATAARAFERPHDCALIDLELPDGTGFELLRTVRERGLDATPVVILTGHDDPAVATECLQAGAQDYLVKGRFESDALLRAIRYARERWRLLREVLGQREALTRSNVELERFAHVASHDLQEPLRTLQTLGARLEERAGPALDDRCREYVRRMRGSAERMQRLIRDLLELSRVQTAPVAPERVDLAELVRRVTGDLAARIDEAAARVQVELQSPLPALEAVPTQVERLVSNLLSNSLRYRHPDRSPEVLLSARLVPSSGRRSERTRVEVSVRDNGVGFAPDEVEHVFRPFNRLSGGDDGGTGIGLAVCKAVVERHGGTIRAEGRPGEGATFTFTLPCALGQLEPEGMVGDGALP